jgi:hypothetical protein
MTPDETAAVAVALLVLGGDGEARNSVTEEPSRWRSAGRVYESYDPRAVADSRR